MYDLLVFTHDDVLAPPDWFGAIVHAQQQAGPRAVVTGQVRALMGRAKGSFVPTLKEDPQPAIYQGRLLQDVLYPLNMALYRSAMEAVGPFDERLGPGTPFPAAEDNDFAFRALEAGYTIHYVPQATVLHRDWRGPREYLPTQWGYGRGQGAYYAKYLRMPDGHMRRRFGRELRIRLGMALQRVGQDPRRALGNLIYVAAMGSGALEWAWRSRRRP
jgi:GT2 family glycosyltransferase